MKAVVLVEGESDRIAVETLAARRGRDLASKGVAVVAVSGAHALQRVLRTVEAERVAGLYDRGEEAAILRALDRAGVASDNFYACDPDLEGELVRALVPLPGRECPVNQAAAGTDVSTLTRTLAKEAGVQRNGWAASFHSEMKAWIRVSSSSRLEKLGAESRFRWRIENHCSI